MGCRTNRGRGAKKLEETVELMAYYTKKGDMEQVTKLDTRFQVIYDACKSRVLQNTLKTSLDIKARLTSLKVPKRAYQRWRSINRYSMHLKVTSQRRERG